MGSQATPTMSLLYVCFPAPRAYEIVLLSISEFPAVCNKDSVSFIS